MCKKGMHPLLDIEQKIMFTMFRLAIKKYQPGLAKTLLISSIVYCVIGGATLYFILYYGTYPVLGIPVQMLLATIGLPVLLIALIFNIATKIDKHAWSNDGDT
ncbi:MAG: hypothetical protein L3J32_09710 [Rhizobiaceae bacterium]|nr:hypothetical protein [Rhizobiaceae bacterium]